MAGWTGAGAGTFGRWQRVHINRLAHRARTRVYYRFNWSQQTRGCAPGRVFKQTI